MMAMFFQVPQSHCVAIERFGKFARIARHGLQFKLPWIETIRTVPEWGSVANKEGYFIEMTEQQMDTPPRECHTKDNVVVTANASIYWRITDPVRALYEVDVLPRQLADVALNALRSNIGNLELDVVLSERQRLNARIAAQLTEVAQNWGIQFTRVEIQEIQTTDETAKAMRQQMDAERRRRAAVFAAEGQAAAELKVAEAERDAMVMRAEGRAQSLRKVAEAEMEYLQALGQAVPAREASQLLLAQKMIEGYDRISKNPADKVYLPASFQGLFTLPTDSPSHAASLKAPAPASEGEPANPGS